MGKDFRAAFSNMNKAVRPGAYKIFTAPKFDGVQYKNIGNYCQFIYGDNVECDEYKFVYEFIAYTFVPAEYFISQFK